MKFTYTCKKVSLNDSVKAYAEKKVGKLEKFFKEEPEASVTFSVEKKNRCVAEIMLRGANGTLFRAVCEDPDGDMRGAIDEATAQIERKIRKNKTRLAKNLRAEAVLPELPEEFEAHEEGTFDIVRTKRFTVKPMSVEEAILQMTCWATASSSSATPISAMRSASFIAATTAATASSRPRTTRSNPFRKHIEGLRIRAALFLCVFPWYTESVFFGRGEVL